MFTDVHNAHQNNFNKNGFRTGISSYVQVNDTESIPTYVYIARLWAIENHKDYLLLTQ